MDHRLTGIERRLARIEQALKQTPVVMGVSQEVNNKTSSGAWLPIERPDRVFEAMCWSEVYKEWGNSIVELQSDTILDESEESAETLIHDDADGSQLVAD
jgi:hypothetical protein